MPAPALSIILPVRNEAAGIVATLQALAPLRARGAQVIVVDGGSNDETVTRAQSVLAPDGQLLQSPAGRALQMNAGAQQAQGSMLLFLHADTLLPSDADALIVQAIASGRHVWGRFDVRIAGRPWMLKVIAALMNGRSRYSGIATGDQALFMTRVAFDAVGGFPNQSLMEDIEISRRLLRLSRPACLSQCVVTSGRRWEARGVWRTVWLMWRLRLAYWLGASPDALAQRYR